MYNHYIDAAHGEFEAACEPTEEARAPNPSLLESLLQKGRNPFRDGRGEGVGKGISALLRRFRLDSLDTGDLLLALIVLLLVLDDGDNLDLLIAVGVMLLLSLGEPSCEGQSRQEEQT